MCRPRRVASCRNWRSSSACHDFAGRRGGDGDVNRVGLPELPRAREAPRHRCATTPDARPTSTRPASSATKADADVSECCRRCAAEDRDVSSGMISLFGDGPPLALTLQKEAAPRRFAFAAVTSRAHTIVFAATGTRTVVQSAAAVQSESRPTRSASCARPSRIRRRCDTSRRLCGSASQDRPSPMPPPSLDRRRLLQRSPTATTATIATRMIRRA